MLYQYFFVFKQKTAYELRISDWSSDVCSSDLSAQRQFLSAMSHELRTPLNALIGFAEVMSGELHGPLKPKYVDHAGDIASAGRSEERRVGKECDSKCSARWPPDRKINKLNEDVRLR